MNYLVHAKIAPPPWINCFFKYRSNCRYRIILGRVKTPITTRKEI